MMHVVLRPAYPSKLRTGLFEEVGARQRRQDREAGAAQVVLFDKSPQSLEIGLSPFGVNDELPGDAIAQRARDADCVERPSDGCVLDQAVEPFVTCRFETEKDVEILRDRPPCLKQFRMFRDEVSAALHEQPALANSALPKRMRELKAARRLIPEQIVCHEDIRARRLEIVADTLNRAHPYAAVEQLPDGAERAAERTSARRFN